MIRIAGWMAIAGVLMAGAGDVQAETLTYSGTLYDDGVLGGALFDGVPLGPATAFSFTAVFDPGQPIAALPIGTPVPIPLAPGQAAYVATSVTFTIAGLGTYTVVPGSYAVTVQDPGGPGLFGNFVNDYAVGLAEMIYPGPGALLAGFATATPPYVAASVAPTTLSGDRGMIAEMYVPFTSGDLLAFFLPAPVAGNATATIVPEPADLALALSGLAVLGRVRAGRRARRPGGDA